MASKRIQSPAPKGAAKPRTDADTDRAIQKIKDSRMQISDDGFKAIKAWQYKGGTYTLMDTFLNKFVWVPAHHLLPDWLAPNMVTLIGLLWIVAGYMVLVMGFSTDLYKPAPAWVYVFAAFSNFMYQTLDAIDGKHARRLNHTGPLGQLFDHGCDSVSLTFIAMTVMASMRMGFGVRAISFLFSMLVPFWLSQWSEYHTHMMEHSLGGFVGITEGQLVGMATMALPAVLGPEWMFMTLADLHPSLSGFSGNILPAWYCIDSGRYTGTCALTLQDVLLGAQLGVGFTFVISSFRAVLSKASKKREALIQTVPILLLMVLGFAWCTTIPHSKTHPRLVIFSLGMANTFLNNKMIVAGMTKMEYHAFHTILLPLPIIYVIAKFDLLPRHNDILLGAYCAYCYYKVHKYTLQVVEEISQFLGIYILSLGKRGKND